MLFAFATILVHYRAAISHLAGAFLIAVPSHLLLAGTIVGCPFTTSSLVWPI
jgi:hypothetical protein